MPTRASDLTLRVVGADDIDALADLWHAGWRIGHAEIVPEGLFKFRDLASFRARIVRDLPSFHIAERDGAMVGFIRIVAPELDQFYVAPVCIGQGIAAPLMHLAEDKLREMGITTPHLLASVGNDRAIRFYEREGWRNCGVRTEHVTAGDGTFPMNVHRFKKTLIS